MLGVKLNSKKNFLHYTFRSDMGLDYDVGTDVSYAHINSILQFKISD